MTEEEVLELIIDVTKQKTKKINKEGKLREFLLSRFKDLN